MEYESVAGSVRKLFEETKLEAHKHYLPPSPETMLERFRWLLACGLLICPGYRFVWPLLGWWNNQNFNAYLKKFGELQGMNSYLLWDLGQLLHLIEDVPGDTAECGCYAGASSWLLCTAKREHHIFDSFEGYSEPSDLDGTHWKKHMHAAAEETVRKNLREFDGAFRLYKGWIPSRFDEISDRRFAFVHCDVALYQPTRDSLEFFYPRLNKGAVWHCPNYAVDTNPGATRAVDEVLHGKPEKLILPSSGGAFFIKQ